MGRKTDLELKVQILEVKLEKLQMEAQHSVTILESKVRLLEEKLKLSENTDSKKFKCLYCEKVCFSNSGLVRHLKSKHSEN